VAGRPDLARLAVVRRSSLGTLYAGARSYVSRLHQRLSLSCSAPLLKNRRTAARNKRPAPVSARSTCVRKVLGDNIIGT